MKTLGYYNGKYDEIENMYIPMNDRVSYFGDGIYDATYSRNYKIFSIIGYQIKNFIGEVFYIQ